MKALFDTNIFVSALAIPGGQGQRAVELVIVGKVSLCISKEIVHEILEVLARKFARSPEELSRTAVFLTNLAELVTPNLKLAVLPDESDNRIFTRCAVAGHADIIVTGGRALLELNVYEGIRILSLRRLLDEFEKPAS